MYQYTLANVTSYKGNGAVQILVLSRTPRHEYSLNRLVREAMEHGKFREGNSLIHPKEVDPVEDLQELRTLYANSLKLVQKLEKELAEEKFRRPVQYVYIPLMDSQILEEQNCSLLITSINKSNGTGSYKTTIPRSVIEHLRIGYFDKIFWGIVEKNGRNYAIISTIEDPQKTLAAPEQIPQA